MENKTENKKQEVESENFITMEDAQIFAESLYQGLMIDRAIKAGEVDLIAEMLLQTDSPLEA